MAIFGKFWSSGNNASIVSSGKALNGSVINVAERSIVLKKRLADTESLYQIALNSYGHYVKHRDSEILSDAYHADLKKYHDSLDLLQHDFSNFKDMISGAGADNKKDGQIVSKALELVDRFERFRKKTISFQN